MDTRAPGKARAGVTCERWVIRKVLVEDEPSQGGRELDPGTSFRELERRRRKKTKKKKDKKESMSYLVTTRLLAKKGEES